MNGFAAIPGLIAASILVGSGPQQSGQQRRSAPKATPTPRSTPRAGVYYPNCDAARAAGVAPIYRGQPGYRPALDRDNDGIACEPWRGRR